jgi:hypothetical protein
LFRKQQHDGELLGVHDLVLVRLALHWGNGLAVRDRPRTAASHSWDQPVENALLARVEIVGATRKSLP